MIFWQIFQMRESLGLGKKKFWPQNRYRNLIFVSVANTKTKFRSYTMQHICFLFGWSGVKIKCTVHVALPKQHCNPLQGNYRVELLNREIPVVITGNEFTEYSFLLFGLHFFPCFINVEIVALVPVMCAGNCQFILQGLQSCFNTL